MEIIVERVSCKLRMVSCESWIGVENDCLPFQDTRLFLVVSLQCFHLSWMFRNLSRWAAVNLYFSCASNSWGDAQKSSIANVMMRTRFFCVALWALGSGEFRIVHCGMRSIVGTLYWTMWRLQSRFCRAKRKRWGVNNYCTYEQQAATCERLTINSWMCTTSFETW